METNVINIDVVLCASSLFVKQGTETNRSAVFAAQVIFQPFQSTPRVNEILNADEIALVQQIAIMEITYMRIC